MGDKASLVFNGGISDIARFNSSFDTCKIKICYHGENRNNSVISKDTIEKAIPSLYNCPIVCNYNIEDDKIGGHDVKVVTNGEEMSMVNLTDAVGVIPSNANVYWEEVEDGGVTHEYLCADAILWKRSAAYEKIKSSGVTNQSMEISVFACKKRKDKKFEIESFEFTALCLLGDDVTPCFESASLTTFSIDSLSERMEEMMNEFKAEFAKVSTAGADDIQYTNLKGGNCKLNVDELMKRYNLSPEDINFELDGMEPGDIEEKFKEIARERYAEGDGAGDTVTESETVTSEDASEGGSSDEDDAEDESDDDAVAPESKKKYSCTAGDIYNALDEELDGKSKASGSMFFYEDHDDENVMYSVYSRECGIVKYYKCPYTMTGDKASINFDNPVRQKRTFVDYDDAGDAMPFPCGMQKMGSEFDSLAKEFSMYKLKVESKAVFEQFGDLEGNEMFEKLKEDVLNGAVAITASEIEDKCFSIRGRVAKFSLEQNAKNAMRLPVENFGASKTDTNEPYGGVFVKYGIVKK